MKKIAVMGYGVVGSGVVEVFYKNRDSIIKNAGSEMDIAYILDVRDFADDLYASKFTKDFEVILNDGDVVCVVETIGGITPAYDFVKRCLERGKNVVTSNKELVAEKGEELLKIAAEKGVNFLFEASVGGGIPILRPISQCLAANEITEIAGILNGTSNFILTKMFAGGERFDAALATAQELGYAERDPSADVGGHDACRKICILAALAFGRHVRPCQVNTEGITEITLADVENAAKMSAVIKLIAYAGKKENGKISASVAPAIVPLTSQLSNVDDVFNAVLVKGDAIGEVVFYGRGAGKLPTASAVVADVIDCVKNAGTQKIITWKSGNDDYVLPHNEDEVKMYVLTGGFDAGLVKNIFGNEVNIMENAFVAPKMTVAEFNKKLSKLSETTKIINKIKIMENL